MSVWEAHAQAHARAVFPEESAGVVIAGVYHALPNRAADPAQAHREGDPECGCRLCSFEIDARDYVHLGEPEIVVHSHPHGPLFPSVADQIGQRDSFRPWALIALDETQVAPALVWGDEVLPAPLIGRTFLHYVADCYTLIRDVYRLGREGCALQGIDWPLAAIDLPNYVRGDAWWKTGGSFYDVEPFKIGFREVQGDDVQPGDIFLRRIKSNVLNHGGVLLNGGMILHHLPGRLSRREPAHLWAGSAERWIRWVGDAQ